MEVKQPTEGEKVATANVMKNIRELIKRGMFFGENAGYVHEAINWIDTLVKNLEPAPVPASAPEAEAPKPDLKVVPNGDEAA